MGQSFDLFSLSIKPNYGSVARKVIGYSSVVAKLNKSLIRVMGMSNLYRRQLRAKPVNIYSLFVFSDWSFH